MATSSLTTPLLKSLAVSSNPSSFPFKNNLSSLSFGASIDKNGLKLQSLLKPSSSIMVFAAPETIDSPADTFEKVFARMNLYDMGRSSCVCRKWRYIICNLVFWRNACLKAWQLSGMVENYKILQSKYEGSWRKMWLSRPRVRTDGIYVNRNTYIRVGVAERKITNPIHLVDMIVITDGSRILGLGDLGVQGIGIPIGKLDMYVAAAGINPQRILPVMLDVGTNNQKLLEDRLYLGLRQPRLEGEEYLEIVDVLMEAVHTRWPKAVVQFEDFQLKWAFETLQRYRMRFCMFNDDLQVASRMGGISETAAAKNFFLLDKDVTAGYYECPRKALQFMAVINVT